MASLIPGSPWRNVVHIADRVGVNGGPYYELTLECGHFSYRRKTIPRPHQIFRRVKVAPYRVRCYSCGMDAENTGKAGT